MLEFRTFRRRGLAAGLDAGRGVNYVQGSPRAQIPSGSGRRGAARLRLFAAESVESSAAGQNPGQMEAFS
jgi:hypothetical protein